MRQPSPIEELLREAIRLLDESGWPMAAESLRDNLRAIRVAPTGAARRRRIFQLKDLLEGGSPYRPGWALRPVEDRARRTLAAIQELLASEAGAEADPDDWSPVGRVA